MRTPVSEPASGSAPADTADVETAAKVTPSRRHRGDTVASGHLSTRENGPLCVIAAPLNQLNPPEGVSSSLGPAQSSWG